jgi:diaminopimelate decarboxylase
MMIPDGAAEGPMLQEAMRELEAAIHDARVAFDCISLGEIDRAHTSAVTARVAIDAAVTAVQAELAQAASQQADR